MDSRLKQFPEGFPKSSNIAHSCSCYIRVGQRGSNVVNLRNYNHEVVEGE